MSSTCCLLVSRQQLICYESLLFTLLCGSYKLLINTQNPRAARRSQHVTVWHKFNTCHLIISRQQSIFYELLLFILSCSSYMRVTNTHNSRAVRRGQMLRSGVWPIPVTYSLVDNNQFATSCFRLHFHATATYSRP